MIINPSPPKAEKITISDLIQQCNDAMSTMGQNNPHKLLIYNCALALRQLVDRLATYEGEHGPN